MLSSLRAALLLHNQIHLLAGTVILIDLRYRTLPEQAEQLGRPNVSSVQKFGNKELAPRNRLQIMKTLCHCRVHSNEYVYRDELRKNMLALGCRLF